MVLNRDLTFTLTAIPDCFGRSLRDAKGQFLNALGTWKVVVPEGAASYGIDIDIPHGAYIETSSGTVPAGSYGSILLKGKSAPFKLHFVIGDPDSGDELIYEKTL
jgi:hypothetical protein